MCVISVIKWSRLALSIRFSDNWGSGFQKVSEIQTILKPEATKLSKTQTSPNFRHPLSVLLSVKSIPQFSNFWTQSNTKEFLEAVYTTVALLSVEMASIDESSYCLLDFIESIQTIAIQETGRFKCLEILLNSSFFHGCYPIGLDFFICYFSRHTIIFKEKELNRQRCPDQDLNCRPVEWQALIKTLYHATPLESVFFTLWQIRLKLQ